MTAPGPARASLCARTLAAVGAVTIVGTSSLAAAEPRLALHAEAGAARAVGDAKSEQFGWGGVGLVAPELQLAPALGLELAVGAIALDGEDEAPPAGVAPTESGFAALATAGVRVRPLAFLDARDDAALRGDGLWIAAGFGGGVTSEGARPALRAALGYDVLVDGVAVGPTVGLLQVVEPDAGSLRPEDARIAIFGVHGQIGGARRRAPAAPTVERAAAEPVRRAPPVVIAPVAARPPELDRDGDRIADVRDGCPDDKETPNGIVDDDGCPDTADLHVVGDRIVLDDRVHFPTGSAFIPRAHLPALSGLAEFLVDHPEYRLLHIAGHADDVGSDIANLLLSKARAQSVVDHLVRAGVSRERLDAAAHGEEQPRVEGTTPSARTENRRVELRIVERAGEPTADPSSARAAIGGRGAP